MSLRSKTKLELVYTSLPITSLRRFIRGWAVAMPYLSDKELNAINVAAVTREYRVDPRIG